MFGWGDAVKGVTDLVGQFVEDKDKANELETAIKNKLTDQAAKSRIIHIRQMKIVLDEAADDLFNLRLKNPKLTAEDYFNARYTR